MKTPKFITAEEQQVIDTLPGLNLAGIARVIRRDWRGVNYAAEPYLQAMASMDSIRDNYYMDSGASVVLYFLCNANSYRGNIARACKAELNKRAKACRR
jgi:hypothetical protein